MACLAQTPRSLLTSASLLLLCADMGVDALFGAHSRPALVHSGRVGLDSACTTSSSSTRASAQMLMHSETSIRHSLSSRPSFAYARISSGLAMTEAAASASMDFEAPGLVEEDRISRNTQAVREFFQCWNERDMSKAAKLFSEDVSYEDTLYPEKFVGREQLVFHLNRVADAVPDSFRFVVDEVSASPDRAGVQWHVELADGTQLPFTRGCSMYKFDADGRICYGFDVPEPTLKSGSASLALLSAVSKLLKTFTGSS